MKIQDIAFIFAFLLLFLLKKPAVYVWAGLVCLVFALVLFSQWIFFTGERLTWYAVFFFLVYILLSRNERKIR